MNVDLAQAIASEVMTFIQEQQRFKPDHERLPLFAPPDMKPPTHRHYMVGKIVQQDLGGEEPGYRETLQCPCHRKALADNTFVKVLGPHLIQPRYTAHCPIDGELIAEANTMGELWQAVEQREEREPLPPEEQ